MLNLSVLLEDSARSLPDTDAVVHGKTRLTYAELDAKASQVAGALADRGIGPGDRVTLTCPNLPYFPVVYYGILKAGATVVPLNIPLTEREIAYHLTDSAARAYFCFEGTAELTHSNMTHNALLANRLFGPHPHDVHLLVLPLFHSFGQTVQMNAGFATGATIVLLPRFDAATALELMQAEQVTFFAGVPTMYHALLNCEPAGRFDIPTIAARMRIAVSGGAALPAEVMRRFEERFGVPILEGYGLSETSPIATFNRVDRPRRPGSIGLPVWGVEVKIISGDGSVAKDGAAGEIAIRGHNVMKGYFRRPEATAEAIDRQGWFRTGDIGIRDAGGYLYIVDRKKDLIIRGGFNVYPRELEEVLMTHPEVSLVAVVGIPHPSHGEEVKAFVVRAPGAAITEADLIAWCRTNMAAYKYPRIVEFRDSLPMTATGKILKRELVPQTRQPGPAGPAKPAEPVGATP